MAKKMASKFAGKCKACGTWFPAGTMIAWGRSVGAVCLDGPACAARKAAPIPPVLPEVKAEGAPIAAFLRAAKERGLKFPKVRFLAPGGGTMVLSLAGEKAKVPGSIQVVINREWRGRIEPDGTVIGWGLKADANLLGLLTTIAADPAKAAKEFGALRCACSFCGLALDDAGSIEVGYGPVCAQRWGLPWKRGGAPKLAVPVKLDLPFAADDEAPVKAALAVAERAGIDPAPAEPTSEEIDLAGLELDAAKAAKREAAERLLADAAKMMAEARAVLAQFAA